ncbi:MAG: pyrimidine-specific ribonucleoside hydrolase RihA [Clostridiales bacterium]|nr:MAG: pyrimidine-specific ribonucleoside hydrolase RihA [Clostridiales bacterium]
MRNTMAKRVFIDCDPGLDDAIALMALASRTDVFQLEGITAVAGNQTIDRTFHNARRLAAYLGLNVPVARGAEKPLKRPPLTAGDIHGEDGLAGMHVGTALAPACPLSAVEFLRERLSALAEPATLFCVGPLTNLALLFAQYPEVKPHIDHLTIMGGSLSGGNVTPYAEFNFGADPDAASAVLHSGVPLRLLGLDVTHKAYLTDEEVRRFGALGTRNGRMVGNLMEFYTVQSHRAGLPGTPVHDASAVLYEAEPALFPASRRLALDVVTCGERQGECILSPEAEPNVEFITGVNRERFIAALMDCCR